MRLETQCASFSSKFCLRRRRPNYALAKFLVNRLGQDSNRVLAGSLQHEAAPHALGYRPPAPEALQPVKKEIAINELIHITGTNIGGWLGQGRA